MFLVSAWWSIEWQWGPSWATAPRTTPRRIRARQSEAYWRRWSGSGQPHSPAIESGTIYDAIAFQTEFDDYAEMMKDEDPTMALVLTDGWEMQWLYFDRFMTYLNGDEYDADEDEMGWWLKGFFGFCIRSFVSFSLYFSHCSSGIRTMRNIFASFQRRSMIWDYLRRSRGHYVAHLSLLRSNHWKCHNRSIVRDLVLLSHHETSI